MYSSFAPDRIFKVKQQTINGKKITKEMIPTDNDYEDKVVFHQFGDLHAHRT